MDREEIMKLLPHREPMLLVDTCEKTGEKSCTGTYTVKGDEFFLQGHFPDFPVVPGVILCEIMAQSSCLIFADDLNGCTPFYAGIKNVKFRKSVFPKDKITIDNEIITIKKPFYMVKSTALVNNEVAVSGELTFYLRKNSEKKL
jgi:3-hydroxyacyl-[acyl-carrier-protein] dehydratase